MLSSCGDIEYYGVLMGKLAILEVCMGTLEILPYYNPFMRHEFAQTAYKGLVCLSKKLKVT
jgi:hypothetical protein